MKLRFLNTVPKRLGFSFGLTALIIICLTLFYSKAYFSLYYIVLISVFTYIPVTLVYAIFSTFFAPEEKPSEEILDD